jgi:hypothetical protein
MTFTFIATSSGGAILAASVVGVLLM